jgi:flagellar biosynthesis/type III secretory pathway M-ring protein FliF/YscJ
MTVRGQGAAAWLKLIGAVVALVVSLLLLWTTMARPAVSEAARAEAQIVTDRLSRQVDSELIERKAADDKINAERQQMQNQLNTRLEQIEKTQSKQTDLILELIRRTPK